MREVIQAYPTRLRGRDGRTYTVQACGRTRDDGLWEGWLEFLPDDGSEPLASTRETTQPNRADLVYWATGLTDPYLDGALLRLQTTATARPEPAPAEPATAGPAPRPRAAAAHAAAAAQPVLDPFHVYDEGVDILRSQLRALSPDQLRVIVRGHQLSELEPSALSAMSHMELIVLIVDAVEARRAG